MPFYLIQVAYKDTAAKTLIGHPQSRDDVVKKSCKSLGGKLHSFFFSFGEYDVALIAELPDNIAAAALALDAAAGGAVSKYHTTTLLTPAEGVEAMTKAATVSYAPPK
jgi:uncharacterized protein with GYD domain